MTAKPPTTGSTTRVYFGESANAYAEGVTDGAAAERERIRQLAIGRDATAWPEEGTQRIPFADLLTEPEEP